MHGKRDRIRLFAAIAVAALGMLGLSSSASAATAGIPELGGEPVATAAGPKAKLKCQGTLRSMGIDRSGLELFTWTVCGRRGGVPFG